MVIKLSSQYIDFGDPVTKTLEDDINETDIFGTPKDVSRPGNHLVKLSITDKETGHEYESKTFEVKVVDFAFDHISRPFLLQVTSAISGLASVATYLLTYFQDIDKAFGYTAGTAILLVGTAIFTRSHMLYRRLGVTAIAGPGQP